MCLDAGCVLLGAVLAKGFSPVPLGVVRGEKGIMPVEWAVAPIYTLMMYMLIVFACRVFDMVIKEFRFSNGVFCLLVSRG